MVVDIRGLLFDGCRIVPYSGPHVLPLAGKLVDFVNTNFYNIVMATHLLSKAISCVPLASPYTARFSCEMLV